jgi:demethylmenaquinone methyltransferase/2-methoxy-6-polyprenyl-1,4-benzoquinol methylase
MAAPTESTGTDGAKTGMDSAAHHSLTPENLRIRDNFDAIAPRYDLTNRVISFGIDLHWRKVAVRQLGDLGPEAVVLDLACGTCDMALEVLRQRRAAHVVGADLSEKMLDLARRKLAGRRETRIELVTAPAEALPFRDAAFDGITIAFGIRNVPDYRQGLREMLRVLKPGGRACILEFSTPPSRLLWRLYNYYFFNVLPRIGGWLTGREAAYRYLTESVAQFPGAAEFAAAMEEAGFAPVTHLAMNGGIVCVHTGTKP